MSTKNLLLPGILALAIASCDDRPVGPDGKRYLEIREVTVGPALAKCYGVGEQTCMIVDGGFFLRRHRGLRLRARVRLPAAHREIRPLGRRGTAAGRRQIPLPSAGTTGEDPRVLHSRDRVGWTYPGKVPGGRRLLSADRRRSVQRHCNQLRIRGRLITIPSMQTGTAMAGTC